MTTTLKANALSFVDSTIMGISGSAPAYSIAITTAVLIGTAGTFSPAALLIFAVPMLGIASAYRALSVDDASAGASYQWTSAIFGKMLGFLSGWSLLFATLFFMVSGSIPIATATLNFIAPDAIGNVVATAMLASFWFVLIAGVVLAGITVSSRVIIVMTSIQLLILSVVLVAAFVHAFRVGSVNPFDRTWLGHGLAGSSLANCALIAIYFYWGWDVTSNLGEETDGGGESAGRGGQMSIFVTIILYVSFATSSLLLFSIEQAKGFSDNLIYNMAIEAGLGRWGGLTASVAVILSSIGTLEATMLMFSRTLFAMGRDGVMPRAFGEVHARTQAPTRATLVIVVIGLTLIWASSLMPSVETIIYSLVNALGLHVDYYFGLAGLAAAWIFRSSYRTSLRQWLLRCVFPGLSSVVLIGFGIYAVTTFDALTNLVGLGGFVLGLILYLFRKDRMGIAPPLG